MGQVMDWIKKWQNPDGKAKTALPATKRPAPPLSDEAQAERLKKENDPGARMTQAEQLRLLEEQPRRVTPRKKPPED